MQKISKQVAETLKRLRQQRGWSLDRTARETGVSKAMLGQIEREESSPTIATLWKIASGFQTSFSCFLDEHLEPAKNVIQRVGRTEMLHPEEQSIRIFPLFPFDPQLQFELFVIELSPGCEHLSLPHEHNVIEHVIVTDGAIEMLVDGVWQALTKGEAIRFNADQQHGYRNVTDEPARIHDIIHYPTQR